MAHALMAGSRSQSTRSENIDLNHSWKKNGEFKTYPTSGNVHNREIPLCNPADSILPIPICGGMNHSFLRQHQQSSGGDTNQASNNSTIATTIAPNQASNHSPTSHPNGQQDNNNAWFQHMILNPIHPLQSIPNSVGGNVGGNNGSAISNQVNNLARQQQLQGSIQGTANFHTQVPSPVANNAAVAPAIAKTLAIQQQSLTKPLLGTQQQQQQQNIRQLLPLNDLASQLQVQAARQTQPLQQQQVAPLTNNNQVQVSPNTVSAAASAQQQQQQQQQQQLLLLTLMLQQQNNANNSGSGVDTSALSTALATPEGLRLINSLLVGQQLQSIQGNRVQQQQQANQLSQGLASVSNLASASPAPILGADLLSPTMTPNTQDDGLLNHCQYFLSQQQPQMSPKPAPQPQTMSQTLPLPTLSLLSSNLQSLAPSALNSGETMPSLSKKTDVEAESKESHGIGYSSRSNNKSGNDSTPPAVNSRFPRLLYCESDDAILGEYQTLLRQQLELFEADSHDVINGTFRQGRTTPIRLGQIGLRCKHCAKIPMSARTKGSVYFSQTIKGMYQIGQNMSKVHLCERCPRLPPDIKKRMVTLRSRRHRASGGRAYWIRHLREMGIYEDGTVLRAHPPGQGSKSQQGKQDSGYNKRK